MVIRQYAAKIPTLSVALAVDSADVGETGRRNDGEWHRGLGERTTRVATPPNEREEIAYGVTNLPGKKAHASERLGLMTFKG